MKKLTIFLLCLSFIGCSSTNMLLTDKSGKEHVVTYNSLTQSMEVTINNKKFAGDYVTNSTVAFGTNQNFGKSFSTGTTQTYISGNSGRALLKSSDNETLQCEFTYSTKLIGVCSDNKGEKYNLTSSLFWN